MTRANLNRRLDAEEVRRDLAEKYRNEIHELVHREWGKRLTDILERTWDELDLTSEQREHARAVLREELDKVAPGAQNGPLSDDTIG